MAVPPIAPTPGHDPRVRLADVDLALRRSGITVLPDGVSRHVPGIRLAQMRDAVLVVAGGPQGAARTRAETSAALRDAGFLVKDSAPTSSLLYVLDRM